MVIIELDDFEYHAGIVSVLNGQEQNELAFSPVFVFLIDWAVKNDVLGDELRRCQVFSEHYKKLLENHEPFSSFVLDVLDGKLTESAFSEDVVQFIKDYVEYEGYSNDLTTVYSTNIGDLPYNFENAEKLYRTINTSRKNYEENKRNFPDLVVFTDPEQLKRERAMLDCSPPEKYGMPGNGIEYRVIRGSDVDRDGMYMELSENESKKIVAEVFYSDRTHDFSLSCFQADIPLHLIESLIHDAKQLLSPDSDNQ